MTTTDSTTTSSASDGSPGPDDPRTVFAKAVGLAGWVIEATTSDQLELPTPCHDLDVRGLLGHITDVMERVRRIGAGEDPMGNELLDVSTVADDAWFDLFRSRSQAVQDAWTDAAALDRTVTLPWATASGAGMLSNYTSELTVHTWDLATATGQHPQWDDEVVAVGFGAISRGLPAGGRQARFDQIVAGIPAELRPPPPFGEAVEVPDDASAIDQLVAWTGRRP
jgi:uncharacterized protein (TIGR03086 family)